MKVLEYRYFNTTDNHDDYYNDGYAWSRIYEYPYVLNQIKNLYSSSDINIHNSSWGFEGIHILFKEKLESLYPNTISSDIKKSNHPNTIIYDITQPPPATFKESFDVVLNISTLEEVDNNHLNVFNNLFEQVKVGGYLICTFDIPGLQLYKFNTLFNKEIKEYDNCLTPQTSKLQNKSLDNLMCGVFVVQK